MALGTWTVCRRRRCGGWRRAWCGCDGRKSTATVQRSAAAGCDGALTHACAPQSRVHSTWRPDAISYFTGFRSMPHVPSFPNRVQTCSRTADACRRHGPWSQVLAGRSASGRSGCAFALEPCFMYAIRCSL
eukprot:1972816-Prymnesium_polylepis.2